MQIVYPTVVFTSSFVVCILPRLLTTIKRFKKYYTHISAISSGFLLGVLLLEFIPYINQEESRINAKHHHKHIAEADNHSHGFCTEHNTKKSKCADKHIHHHHHEEEEGHVHGLSLGMFIAGVTFIFLIAIDILILHHSHCETQELADHTKHDHDTFGTCNTDALKHSTSLTQAIVLISALSVHSFFEGLVFHLDGSKTIELSILVHKFLESFALGVTLATSKFKLPSCLFLSMFYSALTPLGMMITTGYKLNETAKMVFNGLALGSTLFIVCFEMIPTMFHENMTKKENLSKILCLGSGFLFTSVIFKFMSHSH